MEEFREIDTWLQSQHAHHEIPSASTLPDPTFVSEGRQYVSFSTNNYLGLATSQRLIGKAREGLEQFGVGNCESRLLGGDLDIYRDLEAKLATLKHKESALLFATGYLTNLGVLSALVKTSQLARLYGFKPVRRYSYTYFSDEYNHISIREGIRMSGADKVSYRHLDLDHLESKLKACVDREKIIVSDGVFSQDGDIAPLPGLLELAELYDATVYIDDAHGTGVLGEHGGGTSEYFNAYSPRLIQMGTLSKAYGAIGGFIATESHISEILRLTSSAYGFTSTLPPDQAFAVSEAIDMSQDEPERRKRLWENQRYFVSRVEKSGYHIVSKATPIVPVFIGDERKCDRMAALLKDEGIHVDAVKFPAVGLKQSRLRFIMNANHTRAQIDKLVEVLESLAQTFAMSEELRSKKSHRVDAALAVDIE
ncbi:MAG: pyridoxal phosphate-dependent aminotransferase family protein [Gammaproteobacteria bacterium]|nr:pyridoxal phosphate-dependent aminotransferase family protein [Gammaproteobacteria bacterium]MBU1977740.1 pyridoxal phosphate-dependent aminotransferase family protein [Gammaproteobacteria bacterium]